MKSREFWLGVAGAFWMALRAGAAGDEAAATPQFLYADTRNLVSLVEDAATLVEQDSAAAFEQFRIKGSRWLTDDIYFFAYDLAGICVFHPMAPELVGQDLSQLQDMNGKPVIRLITAIGSQPERNAHGWVFYLWEDGTQFFPEWKSSYIRKVVTQQGQVLLVGSGLYNLKIEQAFIKERVSQAAQMLRSEGKEAAFSAFRDLSTPFYFLNTYIFVMDSAGRFLVDPAYPTHVGRNLSRFQDAAGHFVVQEMLDKLSTADEAWVQYMWPRPGESLPSRKVAYVRKAMVNGEALVVGSDFFLATPIWMKP